MRKGNGRHGALIVFLNGVIDSGNAVSEVDWASDYKSPKHAVNSIRCTIKRRNMPIMVVARGEHIYLVRKDMIH